jgi:hypothetical protein
MQSLSHYDILLPRKVVPQSTRRVRGKPSPVLVFGFVSGHDFSRAAQQTKKIRALQAAEKTKFFEGDGLQAVRK